MDELPERSRADAGLVEPASPATAPVAPVPVVVSFPGQQVAPAASAALIMAIAGLFICPVIGGVAALILVARGRQMIEDSGGALTGARQLRLARTTAVISIIWGLVMLVAVVALFVPIDA